MGRYTKQEFERVIMNSFSNNATGLDNRNQFIFMKITDEFKHRDKTPIGDIIPQIYDCVKNMPQCADINMEIRHPPGAPDGLAKELVIQILPKYFLCIWMPSEDIIAIMLNGDVNSQWFYDLTPSELSIWISKLKQMIPKYEKEWEEARKKNSKKEKTEQMAALAIKAIFTDAMKDYPFLKYEFIRQKRRLRIKVRIPNTRMGVYIDGWWGTYKKNLPLHIEDLKKLIDIYSSIHKMDFFRYK